MSTSCFGCGCHIERNMHGDKETWGVGLCPEHAKALFAIAARMSFDVDTYNGDIEELADNLREMLAREEE